MRRLTRREFIGYSSLAAIAAASGLVSYDLLRNPSQIGRTTQQSTQTLTTYKPPLNAPPNYGEFMSWLHSVSKPFVGQTQNVSLEYEFPPLALQSMDLDFYDATGINNVYSLKPYSLHLGDIATMVTLQAPTYDVYSIDYQDVGSFKDDIISPTQLAETYPDLTYETINPDDFWEIPWSYLAQYPPGPFQTGTPSANALFLPFDMATMVQFYRQDIFNSIGLSPALTWNEYVANSKALTGHVVPYGTVNEAAPDISIVFEFMNFLPSYGASLWEVKGSEIVTGLTSNSALNALETYLSLNPYSNPSSYTFSWPDIATTLYHGLAGQSLEFEEYSPYMDDVSRSLVADKIGYAGMPAGPSGAFSTFGGSGVAVSKFTRHPEIAWLWLQWATALGTQEAALKGYFHPFPTRKSVLDNTAITELVRADQLQALIVAKRAWESGGVSTLLPFPKWFDVLDPISFYLNQAWTGSLAPGDALSKAVQKIDSWGTLTF